MFRQPLKYFKIFVIPSPIFFPNFFVVIPSPIFFLKFFFVIPSPIFFPKFFFHTIFFWVRLDKMHLGRPFSEGWAGMRIYKLIICCVKLFFTVSLIVYKHMEKTKDPLYINLENSFENKKFLQH